MQGNTKEKFKETVRTRAEEQADTAREELGEVVVEATSRYFPEAVMRRRRRDVAGGFVAGAAVGFLIRHFASER